MYSSGVHIERLVWCDSTMGTMVQPGIPIETTPVVGAAVVEQMVTPAVEVVSNIPIETTPVVEQMVTPAVEVVSNRSTETTAAAGFIPYSTYIRYGNNNDNYWSVFDDIIEPCLLLGHEVFYAGMSNNFYDLGVSRVAQGTLEALQETPRDLAFTSDTVSKVFEKFLEYLKTSNLPNVLKSDERFLIWFAYALTQWAYTTAYPDASLDLILFFNI